VKLKLARRKTELQMHSMPLKLLLKRVLFQVLFSVNFKDGLFEFFGVNCSLQINILLLAFIILIKLVILYITFPENMVHL
jgi:hypothetical protein